MKIIDLIYHHHQEFNSPQQVLDKHAPSTAFARHLDKAHTVKFVKHLNHEGRALIEGITFVFFRSRNRFWHVPFATHRYIKGENPDVILVEGLVFPLQVIFLRMAVGKRCKIIAQHHGERPFRGIKRMFQRIADDCIDRYLFTSTGNAKAWCDKGVIPTLAKCFELQEASTDMLRKSKSESRARLNLPHQRILLWVGRLEANKDPLTVLNAFAPFATENPGYLLYMIYQENDLLDDVEATINAHQALRSSVVLVGKVDHNQLTHWYSAADFYISGSHREGSGYALIEAMACGCIPVVTDIPSFRKLTDDGRMAFLYPPGDTDALSQVLQTLRDVNMETAGRDVENYFQRSLTFKNIAVGLQEIVGRL